MALRRGHSSRPNLQRIQCRVSATTGKANAGGAADYALGTTGDETQEPPVIRGSRDAPEGFEPLTFGSIV